LNQALEMDHIAFELDDVLETIHTLTGFKSEDKGLEFMFDIQLNVPTALKGDPLRLGQILTNICNNAIKFTDAGGEVVLKIQLEKEGDEKAMLHFSVTDSGIGITPEQQAQLFQPFSQADTTTTRKYGGSGLGLVISKQLVEMMNGKIWVESTPDIGSTFHFTVELDKQKKHSLPLSRHDNLNVKPLNVLVVDDNETSREILAHLLEHFHFNVKQADSGRAAIEILRQSSESLPYDLVLLDWRMPNMDGIETTRRIQNDIEITQTPKIIMISAYSQVELKMASKGIDFAGLLHKPVTPSMLFTSVLSAMGHKIMASREPLNTDSQDVVSAIEYLRGAKVLLVEDNEINMELASELLTTHGINVEPSWHGKEALEILENNDYDIVLMDCQMPVMDGYEATRRIRQKDKFRDLPIIAMTANVMVGDRIKAMDAGMNDHIPKPINLNHMLTTMAKWIKQGGFVTTDKKAAVSSLNDSTSGDFPRLPGIDTDLGLMSVQNNAALYKKLLLKFNKNQKDFGSEFNRALKECDSNSTKRLAHTLKGVAGSLGMSELQQTAQVLEEACNNNNNIETSLEQVLSELDIVTSTLEKFSGDSKPKQPANIEKSTEAFLFRELHHLISQNNINAPNLITQLTPLFSGTNYADDLARIANDIEAYDFESAMENLNTLLAQLKINLP
jgi:two-component system, sensor histidine kinase and response regulator